MFFPQFMTEKVNIGHNVANDPNFNKFKSIKGVGCRR
jgi:hypothetical protein